MPIPPRFHASLVNHAFGDPGLIIQFLNEKKAFLFDLGNLSVLSVSQILNISHVFITHTHIDHFFGFDRMLRICLGKNKTLHLYGPPGLFHNTEGKLAGYHWNLINNYSQNFTIFVTEVHLGYMITKVYQSKSKFKPSHKKLANIKDNIILSEKTLYVTARILDHNTPCLGFSLQEQDQIKILPDKLKSMGLIPGPWINFLKHSLCDKKTKKKLMLIPNKHSKNTIFNLENLREKITQKHPGEKITYITDVRYTNKNRKIILKLALRSTHLFIEAVFSNEHKNMAAAKYHLTAKQAGRLARMSKSKKITLFHHSPRYSDYPYLLKNEAEAEFRKQELR